MHRLKLQDIIRLSNSELPGSKAHIKMSPNMRKSARDIRHEGIDYRESAVLILLFEADNDLQITLIERNAYDGVHSGQMAFPGGSKEEQDNTLLETALRETHEEIGVNPDRIQFIRELSDIYIPPSNFMVTPFLSVIEEKPLMVPDPSEVQDILLFPVSALLNDSIIEQRSLYLERYKANLNFPAFIWQDKMIWGATAIILAELKEMILNLD